MCLPLVLLNIHTHFACIHIMFWKAGSHSTYPHKAFFNWPVYSTDLAKSERKRFPCELYFRDLKYFQANKEISRGRTEGQTLSRQNSVFLFRVHWTEFSRRVSLPICGRNGHDRKDRIYSILWSSSNHFIIVLLPFTVTFERIYQNIPFLVWQTMTCLAALSLGWCY